ncbi:hypothetical protein AJ78_05827, partial [Emergomyces pasteurianus Ep9510]
TLVLYNPAVAALRLARAQLAHEDVLGLYRVVYVFWPAFEQFCHSSQSWNLLALPGRDVDFVQSRLRLDQCHAMLALLAYQDSFYSLNAVVQQSILMMHVVIVSDVTTLFAALYEIYQMIF